MKKPTKRASSGRRMMDAGQTPAQIWLKPEARAVIERAALIEGLAMATFIREAAVREAERILEEHKS